MKKVALYLSLALLIPWLSRCKKSGSDKPKKAIVTTIAGTGEAGYLDATASFAKFQQPVDVAVHTDGTVYITDFGNRRLRKITPQEHVHTVAGDGNYGNTNGNVTTARFKEISMIALDAAGNIYILDGSNWEVRKITGAVISVFAGRGIFGFHDGRADSAYFRQCWGITADGNGNVYVADTFNERIRKIANGYVTTYAGMETTGYLDGNALQAQFNKPAGIALDRQGNLYVAELYNHRIRKITAAGIVSTYAGNGTQGFADGEAAAAQFYSLTDVVIDAKGNLYVADSHRIRKITPGGQVSTIAGDTAPGFADGEGNQARFSYPTGLGIDASGDIYVADKQNNRIRKISFQ